MLLTWLVLRTGSIFAGMLLHFLNNGLSVLLEAGAIPYLSDRIDLEALEHGGISWPVLLAAVMGLAAGILLLRKVTTGDAFTSAPQDTADQALPSAKENPADNAAG
jgi:membrane protease YdiL (CAAX protease family)